MYVWLIYNSQQNLTLAFFLDVMQMFKQHTDFEHYGNCYIVHLVLFLTRKRLKGLWLLYSLLIIVWWKYLAVVFFFSYITRKRDQITFKLLDVFFSQLTLDYNFFPIQLRQNLSFNTLNNKICPTFSISYLYDKILIRNGLCPSLHLKILIIIIIIIN